MDQKTPANITVTVHANVDEGGQAVGLLVKELHMPQSPFGARPADLERAFASLIADKTRRFTGRRFVFEALTRFLKEKPSGYFFVVGDPGIGKTALSARLVNEFHCVHHFNIRAEGISRAAQFLGNICAQLISAYQLNYPVLPPSATEDAGFLNILLAEAAAKMPPGKKILIVVDALDEAIVEGDANILCLPKTLPRGVYIIATMRRVRLPLHIECEQTRLEIFHDSRTNLDDIQQYISGSTGQAGIQAYIAAQQVSPAAFVDWLVKKSEGNFMYLHYMLPAIEQGMYNEGQIDALPQGLSGYYEDHWRRMGMLADPLPRARIRIVYILSEVQEPVTRKLISQFASGRDFPVDELTVQSVLDQWDQFLHKQIGAKEARYAVYHTSFREFLYRQDIVQAAGISIPDIHALIAEELLANLYGAR